MLFQASWKYAIIKKAAAKLYRIGGGAEDMRFAYDPKYNIAYLKFQEKSTEVHTLKVSDELNIDLASDGTIYGIELLNANEQIYRQDEGKFLLINEVTGEKAELPLASLNK